MTPHLNAYPLVYTPPGVRPPEANPHRAAFALARPDAGPDAAEAAERGGTCWGHPYAPGDWRRTPAGWWLRVDGHRPQDLRRMTPTPAVLRWRLVPGVTPDQIWRVPVLITAADDGWIAATDRVWSGRAWVAPADLARLAEGCHACASGVPLHDDLDQRNACVRDLALGLLSIGHVLIDGDSLAALGWLGERLMLDVIRAACDCDPLTTGQGETC